MQTMKHPHQQTIRSVFDVSSKRFFFQVYFIYGGNTEVLRMWLPDLFFANARRVSE
jgi:hypothetical protein